jgi:hypothetical protein
VKEGITAHIAELKGHADLGPKPKSVQPIRGEVYSARGQTEENPVLDHVDEKHVNELKRHASLKGEPAPLQPIPAEQQAAERLGKPPPEGVRGEVQLEPAPHREYPVDSLDELRQLARRVLRPPLSPEQLEGVKPEDFEEWARNHPEDAANYATAMLYYEGAVENLAQSMSTDPLKFTANLLRRILHEREERPKPPEN